MVLINLNETRLNPTYSAVLKIIISPAQTIKLNSMPSEERRSFSSINPKIRVGMVRPIALNTNFKYSGFCGQFLLSRIRLKTVVIAYSKVKPISSA